MVTPEVVWGVGRWTLQPAVRFVAPLRVYGAERIPREGGLVLALNHFSWVDPPAFGAASPRTIYYMAKMEIHRAPGLGPLIRAFGTFAVRRGESDREAVRLARELVRGGRALGFFVEGTRQRSGVPGEVKPGAAMVALQEGVPVLPGAIHGSQTWRLGNFQPVSVAWGTPLGFGGLPRSGRGYREASAEIERELRRLWEFLVEMHALGRPEVARPPAALRVAERERASGDGRPAAPPEAAPASRPEARARDRYAAPLHAREETEEPPA